MTRRNKQRPSAKDSEDLLRHLDNWLARRGGNATLTDVLQTRDHLLFAAFILRGFRLAAREAVFDRFKLEARLRGLSDAHSSTKSFYFMIESVAQAWSLADDEKIKLLGLTSADRLTALQELPFEAIPPETLERGAIVVDIYAALNTILPHDSARAWVRAPNSAPLFAGESALKTMIQGSLRELRRVRAYLRAEAAGN